MIEVNSLIIQIFAKLYRERADLKKEIREIPPGVSAKTKILISRMVHGAARHFSSLNREVEQITKQRITEPELHAAAVLGLYALDFQKIPPYVVTESIAKGLSHLGFHNSAGIVGYCLREHAREGADLSSLKSSEHYPAWLSEKILSGWPEKAEDIFKAGNNSPPLVVRNRFLDRNDEILYKLKQQSIKYQTWPEIPGAIKLPEQASIPELEGIVESFFRQSLISQMVSASLPVAQNARVWDMAASSGIRGINLFDLHSQRLERLVLNEFNLNLLSKLKEKVSSHIEDPNAEKIKFAGTDGRSTKRFHGFFDSIFLAAPSTGVAVMARRPELKIRLNDFELAKSPLLGDQRAMLKNAWASLKPGGFLLYSVKSFFEEEGEQQVGYLLRNQRGAQACKVEQSLAEPLEFGSLLWPNVDSGDGGYFALIRKNQ